MAARYHDKPLTASQKEYLIAFETWLHEPSAGNLARRADAFQRLLRSKRMPNHPRPQKLPYLARLMRRAA